MLSDRHVETALFHLVLDVATAFITLVAQNFGQHPFQGIVTHLALQGLVAVVANVYRSAIEVTTLLSGIGVVALKFGNILH